MLYLVLQAQTHRTHMRHPVWFTHHVLLFLVLPACVYTEVNCECRITVITSLTYLQNVYYRRSSDVVVTLFHIKVERTVENNPWWFFLIAA